jgi:hypothetical protein
LPPGIFLLISVRDLRAIVLLEGLGQLKNLKTSSGIEPTTFQLVPQPTTLPLAHDIGKEGCETGI